MRKGVRNKKNRRLKIMPSERKTYLNYIWSGLFNTHFHEFRMYNICIDM